MEPQNYRVLARKYRPSVFADLIGQEVLVRTLSNAIHAGRIAHAFLLTGIRGVGKTTTARIIARALNCIGADGNGGPTIEPCGVCSNCKMLTDDRHPDIIEMDAASHTGVNDIRDIIDSVHYSPSIARYKIYIIDEVHMLSTSAFNALLKTLEEPPPHVKFVFATTELRKIPVTILSRCQRFDLRRVDMEVLGAHLTSIAAKEHITADAEAIALIATAAEGSVRDSLSLLDQAIAHSYQVDKPCHIETETVRSMLGMADKTRLFELLETLFRGEVADTISIFKSQVMAGADPVMLIQDLMELVHLITRLQMLPDDEKTLSTYSESERNLAKSIAGKLPMAALTRAWQMLLKGLSEARIAPNPLSAAEMVLIRTAYSAGLPSPDEIIQQIKSGQIVATPSNTGRAATASASRVSAPTNVTAHSGHLASAAILSEPATQQNTMALNSFEEVVYFFEYKKEMILYTYLKQDVRLVSFAPGRIELNIAAHVPADFPQRISKLLSLWTQTRWVVTVSQEKGQPSLMEIQKKHLEEQKEKSLQHPLVKDALQTFPGAEIIDWKPV